MDWISASLSNLTDVAGAYAANKFAAPSGGGGSPSGGGGSAPVIVRTGATNQTLTLSGAGFGGVPLGSPLDQADFLFPFSNKRSLFGDNSLVILGLGAGLLLFVYMRFS